MRKKRKVRKPSLTPSSTTAIPTLRSSSPSSSSTMDLDPDSSPILQPDSDSVPDSQPDSFQVPEPDNEQPQQQQPDSQPDLPELPDPSPPNTTAAADVVPDLPPARKGPTGGKRKKPGLTKKRLAEIDQKLKSLANNFRPIPFSSSATTIVANYESLFRALGLWDFAHLELDREIRSDLLVQLIAYYDPEKRRSSVNGRRIAVSRADLARAVALAVKKDKIAPPSDPNSQDELQELLATDDSVWVLTEFIMSHVLLLKDEALIMPDEVVAALKLVKEGQPNKIDWPGLLWTLVEKEMIKAPTTGECFYSSHLQCLLKYQRQDLFLQEVPKEELELDIEAEADGEPSMELTNVEEEEDAGNGARIKSLDEIQGMSMGNSVAASDEDHGAGLSLGLVGDDVGEAAVNGVGKCKAKETQQWISEEKNMEGMVLRKCNAVGVGSMGFGVLMRDEGMEGERAGGRYDDELTAKYSMEINSADLLNSMEAAGDPYGQIGHQVDASSGDFLSMRPETQKNIHIDTDVGNSFLYQNDGKRGIGDMEDDGEAAMASMDRFTHGIHQQKRMRSDGQWNFTASSFDMYIEQASYFLSKAKMIHQEKDQVLTNAHMQIQYLNTMLQQKDQYIQSLQKTRLEEKQRRDQEYCRYEHELKVMSHMVVGYKKALRETRNAFSEYRKQYPQGDEPLYKDVPGKGGIVLSTRELERQRLQKEEEMYQTAVQIINDFEKEWLLKLDECSQPLLGLSKRLKELQQEFQQLKEMSEKCKNGDT